ncbi:MAG: hypothetical protein PHW00_02645 [Clostridia bacterium]|nr:hypothetical protein [Clostridia bacterium]
MDKRILIDAGIDYDNAMKRLNNNVSLYEHILKAYLTDRCYDELREVVNTKDYTQLFIKAHALKGVSGNLDLTGLYVTTCNLVEYARNNNDIRHERVFSFFREIEMYYHRSIEAINNAMNNAL